MKHDTKGRFTLEIWNLSYLCTFELYCLAASISITNNSTSTSTTSTSTTMITTNICTGGYTYVTQLLYLNINSGLPWTQYEFNYTAPNVTTATITFSFRDDPNFWYLDAVSVTNSSGQQLLSNPGFELGTLANWVYCNPSNASHSGSVTGSGCYSGLYCYADGSVGAPDYLSQTFSVQPNNIYTVTFWLCAYGTNMTFAWITISTWASFTYGRFSLCWQWSGVLHYINYKMHT